MTFSSDNSHQHDKLILDIINMERVNYQSAQLKLQHSNKLGNFVKLLNLTFSNEFDFVTNNLWD